MSELEGDTFGHGFVSAGFTASMSGYIDGRQYMATKMIATTLVGGTASRLSGGKFANGAATAAFSYAFASAADHSRRLDVNDVFDHYDIKSPNETVATDMPNETRSALRKFLRSPPGSRIGRAAINAGQKISLNLLTDGSGYAADFFLDGPNSVTYSLKMEEFLSNVGSYSQEYLGAGLDVLLAHEIGHTDIAASTFGYSYSGEFNWTNEFNAVRYVENPYRNFIGLSLRTTYSGRPIPLPLLGK